MNRIDIELIAHLDESLDIECDGIGHRAGFDGHLAAQTATMLVTFRCTKCGDGLTALLCRGRYNWLLRDARAGSMVKCEICEHVSSLTDYVANASPLYKDETQKAAGL